MANVTFRWSIGDGSYYWQDTIDDNVDDQGVIYAREFKKEWLESGYLEQAFFLALSIGSTQKNYPGQKYIILYNGNKGEKYISQIRENLELFAIVDMKQVEIIDQHDSKITNPFRFNPTNTVWYKWVPIDLVLSDIEILLDIDTIFVGPQNILPAWLINNDLNILFVVDVYCQPSAYRNVCLRKSNEHINVGMVGLKKPEPFRRSFIHASNAVHTGTDYWSIFYAEQESANFALWLLRKNGYNRIQVIDRHLFTWWLPGLITPYTEWIHFLSYGGKIMMMSYFSLLYKLIELQDKLTSTDVFILSLLCNLDTQISEENRPLISKFYNGLCAVYNVKETIRPPLDLFRLNQNHNTVPASANFLGTTIENRTVLTRYVDNDKYYTIKFDLDSTEISFSGN